MLSDINRRQQVVELVHTVYLTLLRETAPGEEALEAEPEEQTPLVGPGAKLDSLGLVSLLVDLEQKITDRFGFFIPLMDDKALSQKSSPFRTVQSLSDYICSLLEEGIK